MHLTRTFFLGAVALAALGACDDDPNAPTALFAATCPTGVLAVNDPITLAFTGPVSPATVTPANIVVADATTGFEFPGSLTLAPSGQGVVFTPASALPFGTTVSVRVQNVLGAQGGQQVGVTVCNLVTQAPPIAEVVWDALENPGANRLLGASLFAPDSGWVASFEVLVFRRVRNGWDPRFRQPYYASSNEVRFINANHGWLTHFDNRTLRGIMTETRDGGLSFDTVFSRGVETIDRLRVDSSAQSLNALFGVGGGGSVGSAAFHKLNPVTKAWSTTALFNTSSGNPTANVGDIDYSRGDTTDLVAVSTGVRVNASTVIFRPGRFFRSSNGGASWQDQTSLAADNRTTTFRGVARRSNGEVFVTGGNGFFAKLAVNGTTWTRINLGIPSLDTLDYTALVYTDVQFAPDNDQIGWVIGQRISGFVQGLPTFQGLIFRTTDGGATWVRQGVRGSAEYGAVFPALSRIEVWSSTEAWIVGDGGTVLSLNP